MLTNQETLKNVADALHNASEMYISKSNNHDSNTEYEISLVRYILKGVDNLRQVIPPNALVVHEVLMKSMNEEPVDDLMEKVLRFSCVYGLKYNE